jgi:TPR repeat protein
MASRNLLTTAVLLVWVSISGLHVCGQMLPDEKGSAAPTHQTAVTLLDSALDELREIEELGVRLTLTEEVVKLLSKDKPARCRRALDSLFEEALRLKYEGDAQRHARSVDPDSLIRRIIQLATSVERKLANSYIERYAAKELAHKNVGGGDVQQAAAASADLYLSLAAPLIEKDPSLAVAVAEKSVGAGVSTRTLEFLGALRKRDVNLANAFFTTALQQVKARQGRQVNELLLLYSYVFSPTRLPFLTPQGLVLQQLPGYTQAAQDYPVVPEIATRYLQVAGRALLSADRYGAENSGISAAALSDLYFINLIKPLVDIYTPTLAAPLSERRSVLVGYLQPEQYTRLQTDIDGWNTARSKRDEQTGKTVATIESLLSRAEATSDPARRDQLYYRAATLAVGEKKYEEALDIVEKITAQSRPQARDFISFTIAQQSVADQRFEEAEQWARNDVDLARRAYVFILIAHSLLEGEVKDYARASALLVEVERLAAKLDNARERISLLLREADAYAHFDEVRAFEVFKLALKAANQEAGFAGNSKVSRRLEIGGFSFFHELYNDNNSLMSVLNRLALRDFHGTLTSVRALQNRVLRLKSVIALCRGVLTEDDSRRS